MNISIFLLKPLFGRLISFNYRLTKRATSAIRIAIGLVISENIGRFLVNIRLVLFNKNGVLFQHTVQRLEYRRIN